MPPFLVNPAALANLSLPHLLLTSKVQNYRGGNSFGSDCY